VLWRRRTRLDEEVASHLAQETADNIARGMEPATARSAAMRAFGNVEAAKEMVRERDPLYWVDTLWQDIRFAIRLIARSRWLSATIVATLTVGITINVSVFSLLNGFFLRPWVRSEPGTLVSVIADRHSPMVHGSVAVRTANRSAGSALKIIGISECLSKQQRQRC
jgi:putative ABC transport system permease protein